jgi:hypothetical protein
MMELHLKHKSFNLTLSSSLRDQPVWEIVEPLLYTPNLNVKGLEPYILTKMRITQSMLLRKLPRVIRHGFNSA